VGYKPPVSQRRDRESSSERRFGASNRHLPVSSRDGMFAVSCLPIIKFNFTPLSGDGPWIDFSPMQAGITADPLLRTALQYTATECRLPIFSAADTVVMFTVMF